MSDVNKLDNKQCPFDPEQFKVKIKSVEYEAIEPKIKSVEYEPIEPKIKSIEFNDSVGAPVGTFPWAIIQVYLKKPVRRSGWASNVYLIPEYDNSGNLTYIQQSDADGNPSTWVPEPKDMLACDWELVKIKPKPVECMLSFDLEVGVDPSWGKGTWGYSNNTSPTFGTLTNFQSSIGIGSITQFHYFPDTYQNPDLVLVCSPPSPPNLQSKNLEVAVNGSIYNLGSSTNATNYLNYQSDGAKQLGDFLKQNVGNTTPIHFCFNWK
ncbi:Thoeris anti-defense Tad2 family protein [Xenorhabdus stockiae]|uniref:Thoeris anti-defense Tad2 family protein n=1 Tax=Xenorhabdus stockiae TaxID=351614 RepID=UPI00406364E5